ncbi:hypothetical protein JOQ06_030380, partial [Pogonophryne albipinna]
MADCTAKEMKSNSLQFAGVLLPQSGQVPPRLSESQCDAFHVTRSCSIKHRKLFEALCLRWYSCDPAANYQVSKGLLGKLKVSGGA